MIKQLKPNLVDAKFSSNIVDIQNQFLSFIFTKWTKQADTKHTDSVKKKGKWQVSLDSKITFNPGLLHNSYGV